MTWSWASISARTRPNSSAIRRRKTVWRIGSQPTWRSYPGGVLLLANDPTNLSTPLGKLVIAAGLLVVIVVAVRFLWDQRNR